MDKSIRNRRMLYLGSLSLLGLGRLGVAERSVGSSSLGLGEETLLDSTDEGKTEMSVDLQKINNWKHGN